MIDQGIDSTTPSGRLLFHVLAAIAEFERDLIPDRVLAGLARARVRGTRTGRPIGRPRKYHLTGARAQEAVEQHGGRLRATARSLRVPLETLRRALARAAVAG